LPIYSFQCENSKCQHIYEILVRYDSTGNYKRVKCPKCKSVKKKQQISRFAFVGSTDAYNGSHDYRFKTKLPNAIDQREKAQKKAEDPTGYVGKKPYKDFDDLNKNNFGEVK
jgi:putative FmdB family regulatory protein